MVPGKKKNKTRHYFPRAFLHFLDVANTVIPSRIHSAPSTVGRVEEEEEEEENV